MCPTERRATVVIRDRRLEVLEGLVGSADLRVTADAETWLGFLRKERSLLWALLRRTVRLSGPIGALQALARCVTR